MVLKARNAFIPMMGIALALQAGGCKKDKESKTDLLVGEWEVIKLDGDTPDYKITFEFQSDKDMKLCTTDEQYNLSYCYNGGWDWASSKQDEVDLDWKDSSGDSYNASIQIDKLSKDELEGQLTSDGDTYDVIMEKID